MNRVIVGLWVFSDPESVVGNMEVEVPGGMASTTPYLGLLLALPDALALAPNILYNNNNNNKAFKSQTSWGRLELKPIRSNQGSGT